MNNELLVGKIDAMEAGNELDALIAEHIFNLQVLGISPCIETTDKAEVWLLNDKVDWGGRAERLPIYLRECRCAERIPEDEIWNGHISLCVAVVPRYSADIAAAWLVVEKMKVTHGAWVEFEDTWRADFQHGMVGSPHFSKGTGSGDTAPLAICRAALKAVAAKAESTD